MWQIVANLEFVTGFAIDLQTRKPNISPRVMDRLKLFDFACARFDPHSVKCNIKYAPWLVNIVNMLMISYLMLAVNGLDCFTLQPELLKEFS